MRRESFGSGLGRGLLRACLSLIVVTGLGLIVMPSIVGAEWPGWTSTMLLVAVLGLPTAAVLAGFSAGAAKLARWIGVLAAYGSASA